MNRFIAALLAFVMAISLNACSRFKSTYQEPSESEIESQDETHTSKDKDAQDIEPNVSEGFSINPPKQSGVAKPDFGTLSDDLYSFQVEINGDLYQFPVLYTDFLSYGWKMDGDDNEKIDSNFYQCKTFFLGNLECYADIVNFDINAHPIKDCYIAGISIDTYQSEYDKSFSMRLPKSIEFGKSTVEDVKTAYGSPSDFYEDDYYTNLKYKKSNYQEIRIDFSSETGTIEKIQIQNFEKPKDFVGGEVSTEVPDIVKRYRTPEKLEDDFSLFIVQYGEDYYQLPAPVSCFIANGWKIIESESDMVVAGRDFGWVTLTNENQKLRSIAQNYSETATSIENCFLTTVESSTDGNKTQIKIARGIIIGMKETKLEQVLSGVEYEKDTLSSPYHYYEIEAGSHPLNKYDIRTENGVVERIVVSNGPEYSEFIR